MKRLLERHEFQWMKAEPFQNHPDASEDGLYYMGSNSVSDVIRYQKELWVSFAYFLRRYGLALNAEAQKRWDEISASCDKVYPSWFGRARNPALSGPSFIPMRHLMHHIADIDPIAPVLMNGTRVTMFMVNKDFYVSYAYLEEVLDLRKRFIRIISSKNRRDFTEKNWIKISRTYYYEFHHAFDVIKKYSTEKEIESYLLRMESKGLEEIIVNI